MAVRTSFSLQPAIQDLLKVAADAEGRSVSALIKMMVNEGLEKRGYSTKTAPKPVVSIVSKTAKVVTKPLILRR